VPDLDRDLPPSPHRRAGWARTAGLGFALLWATLLLHEAAHWLAGAAARGTLRTSWSDFGQLGPAGRAFTSGAGPALTSLVLLGCILLLTRRQTAGTVRVIAATAIGAASRAVIIAGATWLTSGWNDERTFQQFTHVPATLSWSVEAIIAGAAIGLALRRLESAGRWSFFGWTAVGTAVGWISAMTVGRAAGLPI